MDSYLKAIFDSLTHAGVWKNDSQVKRFMAEWGEKIPKGKSEVTILSFDGEKNTQTGLGQTGA